MPSLKPLEICLAKSWPTDAWAEVPVLLAVSGGADSMALLRAMAALKAGTSGRGQLAVAHLNHQLRGAESDQDQQMVVDACESLGLPCHLGQADVNQLAQQQGDGLEAAARGARYTFLTQTAERLGARYVVTAHTANDQVETILHRVLRGTGLSGIAGVPRTRSLSPAVALIRPLLTVRRVEIESYLDSIGQSYRDDASNTDRAFTRNRIRHDLLPQLRKEYNPNVDEAILRLGELAGQAQSILKDLADDLLTRALVNQELLDPGAKSKEVKEITLVVSEFANEPRYLVREALQCAWQAAQWPQQAMGYEAWDRLTTLALASINQRGVQRGNQDQRAEPIANLPGNIRAERAGDRLTLTRAN